MQFPVFQQTLLLLAVFELAVQVTSFSGSATSLGETPPCQNSNTLWEVEEFYIKLLQLNKTVESRMFFAALDALYMLLMSLRL